MDAVRIQENAREIRCDIVRMTGEAKSGHPGGSLSCTDILCALYFGDILAYNPDNPQWEERDYCILAKGHAAPALYATLAHAGYFPTDELLSLRKLGSRLQGHPDCQLVPGVEVSTGSLGQGLSIALGIAAGLKLDGKDNAVFAILGDGECEEGQVWEAAMFGAHKKLDNAVAIVDNNGLQIDGPIDNVCGPGDIGAKFEAFGWDVSYVDGHDIEELVRVLAQAKADRNGKPHAIIAKTVKGKGVSFMENKVEWHGVAPKPDEVAAALAELQTGKAVCNG